MQNFDEIIKKFPKKRPDLEEKYKLIFDEWRLLNRNAVGTANTLAAILESWCHKEIAKDKFKGNILEIGAGTLNHVKYEKNFNTYDIIEPFEKAYKNSKYLSEISNIFTNYSEINNKYKKIISIYTFEHMTNLPYEIIEIKKILDNNGSLHVAIPCEGEFAFKTGWKLTTGIAFKLKYKLDYSVIMKHEHINTFEEILILLKNYFKKVEVKRNPFILPIKNFSFYACIKCS